MKPATPTLIISSASTRTRYWRDLWQYRQLLYYLALRDILVRYKQTAIGIGWSVIRPLMAMIVLTWVFGRDAKLQPPRADIPYSLWVMAAMLPWQFFADGLTASSSSLITNSNMVSKVYFPRLIMPVSRIIVSFVDFGITFLIFVGLVVYFHFSSYHFAPSWEMVFIPLFLLLTFGAACGLGVLFAAINVKYRDFTYIVPVMVTFGLYASPVGLDTGSFVRGDPLLRCIFSLNPMVGVIDGFRWCIFGSSAAIYWPGMAVSMASIGALLVFGIAHFRATEASFADFI